ncbi:hypothetical protein [Paenibacillus pini]|uniref:Uncharacterized protein n=1 Tax=Paenibacillus pini JCM 16418 TaxID=1236976 RepID=W7YDX1_9BACL|nr:hypothetical protein [Paenibacillus pini]GAF09105.1 hypothetical protein JCM16418_3224 [Paenibacillus pini JCM 16418]
MKLRAIPIVLTVVVSASVLFGGWFVYRQVAEQSPLQQIAKDYKGVNNAQFDINRNLVSLKLDLKPDANLPGLIDQINKKGKSIIGTRPLKLDFVDHSSDKLNQFWDQAMFPVAEAMESKTYTQIPTKLMEMAKTLGIETQAEMDINNVYIRLSDGKASKFLVLPRDPAKMGVWE